MARSLNARLRDLWLNVHLWLGVGLLIAIIPLSVSGAALVWHDALDRALYAERYAVSGPEARLPPQAYVQAATQAFDGQATFTQLRMPQKAGDPVVAVGRLNGAPGPGGRPRSLNVWIDPPTGKVLATQDLSTTLTQTLHRLHGTLLIPDIGRKVVGWLGWAMFVSSATGLWLWWPRNGAFLKGLRWTRGPDGLFNLHHMIGFWICLPLAVLSLTGVYISFPQTSRAVFGVAQAQPQGGPGGGAGRFAPPIAQPTTSLEAAVQAALASKPGAQLVSVNAPTQGKAPAWRVSVKSPGQAAPANVQVVDATGEVKAPRGGTRSGAPEGGPDPLSQWMRRVHDGGEMGALWQTIIFLGGIAPAVLAITGLIMWLQRRGRKAAMRERIAAAE